MIPLYQIPFVLRCIARHFGTSSRHAFVPISNAGDWWLAR